MKLSQLVEGLPHIVLKGAPDLIISGLTENSRAVHPGYVFVARGRGTQFIPMALAAGAVAVLTSEYDPFLKGCVQMITDDVPSMAAVLAERFYGNSSHRLKLVGITGTNGKTTTSYLIHHLLNASGIDVGMIGSIERKVAGKVYDAPLNTPDLLTTLQLLRAMVDGGQTAATMEVSSHGLAQGRVRGIDFHAAVFTNLTQDHLDFHRTMEAYGKAKSRLFEQLGTREKWAIVNGDDPAHHLMLSKCPAQVMTYGIEEGELRASDIRLSQEGTQFQLNYEGRQILVQTPLIGRFNVYNCLAALGVALSFGLDLMRCAAALKTFSQVPGRMERVLHPRGVHIFVDYSHTEDSLQKALKTLREMGAKKIYTVFGCGGDRDAAKRPKMGRVAEEGSDVVIVTSDNPRSEDPETIIDQILHGMVRPDRVIREGNRQTAIDRAIAMAHPAETVLIAGKGHETYQIFAHQTLHFDDREVAAAAP